MTVFGHPVLFDCFENPEATVSEKASMKRHTSTFKSWKTWLAIQKGADLKNSIVFQGNSSICSNPAISAAAFKRFSKAEM